MLKGKGLIVVLTFILFYMVMMWGIGIGKILFGTSLYGLAMGAVIGIVLAVIGIQAHEKIILKVTRSQPINPAKHENICDAIKKMSSRYKIKVPKIYCTNEMMPNFLVFGSSVDRLNIVFTREFLEKARTEMVIASICWAMTLEKQGLLQSKTLASSLAFIFMAPAKIGDIFSLGTESRYNIVNLILLLPLAPLASILVHLGAGAKKEIYDIDSNTATLTGDQGFLGVTLMAIDKKGIGFMVDIDLTLVPLYISPPPCVNRYHRMFRPFPPISKRINRLMKRRKKERTN